jgi:hypoxanthine phosphoribosyltransferase
MDRPSEPARDGYPPVLVAEEAIRERVRSLGSEITEYYAKHVTNGDLIVLGVLKGAFMFLADLVRYIDMSLVVDFVAASSYGEKRTSSGAVRLAPSSWPEAKGRDVLIVEDVLDTGRTLQAIVAAVKPSGARTVRTVALLRKPGAHIRPDHVGFDIDDRFVVGYGLDDAGRWRHLPYIGYIEGTEG